MSSSLPPFCFGLVLVSSASDFNLTPGSLRTTLESKTRAKNIRDLGTSICLGCSTGHQEENLMQEQSGSKGPTKRRISSLFSRLYVDTSYAGLLR